MQLRTAALRSADLPCPRTHSWGCNCWVLFWETQRNENNLQSVRGQEQRGLNPQRVLLRGCFWEGVSPVAWAHCERYGSDPSLPHHCALGFPSMCVISCSSVTQDYRALPKFHTGFQMKTRNAAACLYAEFPSQQRASLAVIAGVGLDRPVLVSKRSSPTTPAAPGWSERPPTPGVTKHPAGQGMALGSAAPQPLPLPPLLQAPALCCQQWPLAHGATAAEEPKPGRSLACCPPARAPCLLACGCCLVLQKAESWDQLLPPTFILAW